MFSLASKASAVGDSAKALARVSNTFDSASNVIAGKSWGGSITWTGGVAPYKVGLFSNTVVQYQATGISASTYTLRGAAMKTWTGSTMSLQVTDSTGASVTTAGQAI